MNGGLSQRARVLRDVHLTLGGRRIAGSDAPLTLGELIDRAQDCKRRAQSEACPDFDYLDRATEWANAHSEVIRHLADNCGLTRAQIADLAEIIGE